MSHFIASSCRTSAEELVHLIRSLGKIPVQRDTLYRDVRVWN